MSCYFYSCCRRLQEAPNVHHAEHLAAIRKACGTDPLALIKAATKTSTIGDSEPLFRFDGLEGLKETSPDESEGAGINLKGKASKFLA